MNLLQNFGINEPLTLVENEYQLPMYLKSGLGCMYAY